MPRRTATIEEEFDDDTDLPLPNRPLPNTGTRGAILEEIGIDSDQEVDEDSGDEDDDDPDLVELSSTQPSATGSASRQEGSNTGDRPIVTDIKPYKSWTCIYPIYIDAKKAYGTGGRRVSRAKAVWHPLSKDIAEATSRLGLGTLHEVNKCHPRDWENPGRVRVQWKRDGQLINPSIKSKKLLLEWIAYQIQRLKPELIPKPPYTYPEPKLPPTSQPKPTASGRGKQSQQKSKQAAPSTTTKVGKKSNPGCRLPVPPEPQPALNNRLSTYSPAIAAGVLIDTIKAGMSATEGVGAGGPGPNLGGKGKRKVVRVRQ
ncbi:signal recognition particle, SRP19 subunit [Thelephora ganbajun]|uniref:Signal recognition particle, SRP19 subunit n=1 Tax=Thelephora ganbajun TaxID=370292 RepID=A0ACB6ZVW6_THEGA|nr:signal recognition particle, SRP19 subunit [Thelephora ganbajun]